MKEVRSLTTTQDRRPPRAHPLETWFILPTQVYPLDSDLSFDQLAFFLIWSILNSEICSKEDKGFDNRDLSCTPAI